jgi:hypothetical protein
VRFFAKWPALEFPRPEAENRTSLTVFDSRQKHGFGSCSKRQNAETSWQNAETSWQNAETSWQNASMDVRFDFGPGTESHEVW